MRTLALALLVVLLPAAAEEEPWALLRQGGHVVLVRHTITTPGFGDPEGFRLSDCSTQRNLSEEGKAHAKRIGEAFREFGVPIDAILSSPWCRCVETAGLAFDRGAEVWPALSNLFGRPENRQRQIEELSARIGSWKGKGNLVLVTHGSTVMALTRISPQTGEMVILAPRDNDQGFAIAARLNVR